MNIFKSKKVQVTLIISATVIMAVGSAIYYHAKNIQIPFFETLSYTTQIVSSFFVMGSVFVAAWQYYLSSKSAKTDLEIIQVQRAIDLSEYYKDNILCFLPAISYIYNNSGISEIVNKIDPKDMEHFDESEMKTLLNDEEIANLDKLTKTDDFANAFLKANYIYNLGFKLASSSLESDSSSAKDGSNPLASDDEVIRAYVGNLFCTALNNMEFFAMHFSHYTADESVVYQSLHQTYLQIVHLLYFKIARMNTASASKYYTNVIWLYKVWIARKNNDDSKFLEGVRNLTTNGTIIKN